MVLWSRNNYNGDVFLCRREEKRDYDKTCAKIVPLKADEFSPANEQMEINYEGCYCLMGKSLPLRGYIKLFYSGRDSCGSKEYVRFHNLKKLIHTLGQLFISPC